MKHDKIQANIEAFEKIVFNNIKREGVEELMDYLHNSDFFVAPASTIYHGSYEGGLCEHCLNVYQCLVNECEFTFGKDWQEHISPESVAIVALFHDLCKVNSYEKYLRNVKNESTGKWEQVEAFRKNVMFPLGHGEKSMFILMNYMYLEPMEALAVRWHMGAFDTGEYNNVNELSKAYEKSILAFLLHVADMKATYIVENEDN